MTPEPVTPDDVRPTGDAGTPTGDARTPTGDAGTRLSITRAQQAEMVAHALTGFPLEACGLLVGAPDGTLESFHPTGNAAGSSKLYTVAPKDMLAVDRAAEDAGAQVIGVMHSHTHTDPWPSPTDVAQAPDPSWHYVIVSLRDDVPMLRSFRIADGEIAEEPVHLRAG